MLLMIDSLVAYLKAMTKDIPTLREEGIDLGDLYCGNEDDAREIGVDAGKYDAYTDILEFIERELKT